jgi:hypothetical protein
MATMTVKLGTTSGTLVTLPHYVAKNGLQINQKIRIKEKETYSGSLNISTTGNSKKIFVLQYENVKHADLIAIQAYNQSKIWYCEISGFGPTKLFAGFCYCRLDDNIKPIVGFDDTILYNFTMYLKEIF